MSGSVLEEISLKLYHCKVFLCKFWDMLVPHVSPGSLRVLIVELTSFSCSFLCHCLFLLKFTDVRETWPM